MAQYNYTVIDKGGKKKRGTLDAQNEEIAREILQGRGMYIIEIGSESMSFGGKKCRTKLRDISLFSRQVSTMLSSGVNILVAIEAMEDATEDKNFKKALKDVQKKVQTGTSVSQAMRDNSTAFPDLLCTMIASGEITGDLDKAFDRMALYYDKQYKMNQKIVNATIYPSILVCVSVLAIAALMIFAIPQFLQVFEEMNIELPAITKFVLAVGSGMKTYWYLLVALVVAIIFGYKAYYASSEGGVAIDGMKLKIPVIGQILIYAALARFSRTLSALIEAGVSMLPAIEITKSVVLNKSMVKNMEGMTASIKAGESLSTNLESIEIIPKIFTVMVKTGEESGQIDYMLQKAADLYENEVDVKVSRINTIIEPVIIVFLALVLGVIMASVMLPMFTLYGSM
ncbi:MAG: type II secretion system F family protein [Clostridium sp.]|uniref:type II secretion system F family protein n=1 Tax=Clostridium sp. TaxID=1506 RepID=UPI002FCCA1F9